MRLADLRTLLISISPILGLQVLWLYPSLSVFWRSELRFPCLGGEHLVDGATSPVLFFFVMETTRTINYLCHLGIVVVLWVNLQDWSI